LMRYSAAERALAHDLMIGLTIAPMIGLS